MATATVTLALNQSTFLAGIARAQGAVRGLGDSVGSIGSKGFLVAGAAALTFGTATAIGIKKAFDLGGRLSDMSAISGRSAKQILLLTRALSDAGVSMEKIDRYILTGQDRGQVIANALKSITAGDWADAARSIGIQADILDKNSKTFDRISDLLGRSGDKLQGFFVGAASKIGNALLPLLEKFDKMDFATQGEKFGKALLEGGQALAGLFSKPELLFGAFKDGFTAVILGIGNLMIAVFKKALSVLEAGAQAAFEFLMSPNTIQGWRKSINSALIELTGKNMSGGLNSIGRSLQKQIDEGEAGVAGSKPTSFADRMLEISNQTPLEVTDVLGAKGALANAQANIAKSAQVGRNVLPMEMAAAGNKKSGGFTVAGASGGINEAEFGNRWGGGTPEPESQKSGKTNALLLQLLEQNKKQTEITEKAFSD